MNINEVKTKYGDRLCLCGGIEVDLLARGRADEVAKLTSRLLNEIAQGGGYCAGSSNSVPEYVNPENYLAMLKTTHEFNQGKKD